MMSLLKLAMSKRVVQASMKIALFVGTLLNLINQGEVIVSGGDISWWHLGLNYCVPYCVASYSAAKNQHALNNASR